MGRCANAQTCPNVRNHSTLRHLIDASKALSLRTTRRALSEQTDITRKNRTSHKSQIVQGPCEARIRTPVAHALRTQVTQIGTNHLDQVGDIHRHFNNAGVVELLNVLEGSLIILCHKVNRHTLTTETATTTDPAQTKQTIASETKSKSPCPKYSKLPALHISPVDVVLPVGGQIIVNN